MLGELDPIWAAMVFSSLECGRQCAGSDNVRLRKHSASPLCTNTSQVQKPPFPFDGDDRPQNSNVDPRAIRVSA